jgi:hypothetical protein
LAGRVSAERQSSHPGRRVNGGRGSHAVTAASQHSGFASVAREVRAAASRCATHVVFRPRRPPSEAASGLRRLPRILGARPRADWVRSYMNQSLGPLLLSWRGIVLPVLFVVLGACGGSVTKGRAPAEAAASAPPSSEAPQQVVLRALPQCRSVAVPVSLSVQAVSAAEIVSLLSEVGGMTIAAERDLASVAVTGSLSRVNVPPSCGDLLGLRGAPEGQMLGGRGEATRAYVLVREGSRVRSPTTQMAVRRPRNRLDDVPWDCVLEDMATQLQLEVAMADGRIELRKRAPAVGQAGAANLPRPE